MTAPPARRPPHAVSRPGPGRRAGRTLTVEALECRCLPSTLQAISLPPPGQPPSDSAAGASTSPSVSADGRFVAFVSSAPNLAPGQTQTGDVSVSNVFLLDRTTNAVRLVSHLPGQPTTAPLNYPVLTNPLISRDGRFIAYSTRATDLVGYDKDVPVVVVYDRVADTTTLVSHNNTSLTVPAATPVNTYCNVDAISGDGRYILFDTKAPDVVPGQSSPPGYDDYVQLFLYDRTSGQIQLVSHAFGQDSVTPVEGDSNRDAADGASLADDGTVAYESRATDLVSFTTQPFNVYLYSPTTHVNQLVTTVAGSPGQDAGFSYHAVISGDGKTVVYPSKAGNLVTGQAGPSDVINVFRHDVTTGVTTLVSGAGGSPTRTADGDSGGDGYALAVSRDGRVVAFASKATDLVPGQTGQVGNLFLYDAQGPALTLVSGAGGSGQEGAGGVPDLGLGGLPGGNFDPVTGGGSQVVSLSDDGGLVAYVSHAADVVPGETNAAGLDNVYLFGRATGQNVLVSGAGGSATAAGNGLSSFPALSGNGGLLAFHTLAFDLGPGLVDANGSADVFTAVPGGPGTTLVSRAAFTRETAGTSFSTSVSADGRYTVFTSLATNLVPNQVTVNDNQNVFLFDKQQGAVTLVNHVPGFPNTTGNGGVVFFFGAQIADRLPPQLAPVISADGRFVAFTSADTNLVPGESLPNGSALVRSVCVYLYDTRTGAVRLVSHAEGQPTAIDTFEAFNPVVSADGRHVAYLVNRNADPTHDFTAGPLALYDSATDTLTCVTPASGCRFATDSASHPSLSDDGRFAAYLEGGQVMLFDRDAGTRTVVSHRVGAPGTGANGASSAPVISHDGSAVAFVSAATDLVSGPAAGPFTNVFLYDVAGGTVRLLSGGGDGNSDSPAIDRAGDYVAYRSDADNLVTGQSGATGNVFEVNTRTGAQALISHRAGDPTSGAGGASAPVIDDDGHLVSYVSTAGDLIPGQGGTAGVENVYVWLRPTNANILASGQDGSPTVGGNEDSDGPLLTRDSFPGFSSRATNLVQGVGGPSVAYINTLVAVSLSATAIAPGSPAGSVVGTLSVSSLLAGQYLPPTYALPSGAANNTLFALGAAAGAESLLTRFQAGSAAQQTYLIVVNVNVGFGDDPVLLQAFGPAPVPTPAAGPGPSGPTPAGPGAIAARLVSARAGRRKAARLLVEVFDAATGAVIEAILSPFQKPAYRNARVTVLPDNTGVLDRIVVTARRGGRTVSRTLAR